MTEDRNYGRTPQIPIKLRPVSPMIEGQPHYYCTNQFCVGVSYDTSSPVCEVCGRDNTLAMPMKGLAG